MIALGFLLRRFWLPASAWVTIEKLVYFVLFPCLLFYSVVNSNFSVSDIGGYALSSPIVIICAFALGWLVKPFTPLTRVDFAAGLQTAYRFNTYIGLALASRLAGQEGVAAFALLVALGVPLCNVLAVSTMSKGAPLRIAKEVVSNPLIIGTVLGIVVKLTNLAIPEPALLAIGRLSNAAVALGLLAVGAGLVFQGIRGHAVPSAFWLIIKLLISPLIALGYARWAGFNDIQTQALFVFAAIPSASSAYILASRMGANAGLVACLISFSTVGAAFTIPLLMALGW